MSAKSYFDVAVAGGGPAGAITALCLARQGVRVGLFEKTNFEGERYGETLPPEINPVLRELALEAPFAALQSVPAPGIVSAWGSEIPVEQDFIGNVHGRGWHVDRNRFDSMLCGEALAAGATLFPGYPAHPLRTPGGGWRIGEIEASFLVDAAGRAGLRIDDEHEYHKDDSLLAIALRMGGVESPDLRTIVETNPFGWWYTAPIPGGQAIAMFFTDPAIYAAGGIVVAEQLETAPLTARRLQGSRTLSTRILNVPSACRLKLCGEGWLAVGDSASAYDPLSGRGIFKAFRHGAAAAEAIIGRRMEQYATRVRREFDTYATERRTYYATEKRWPESEFWRKRSGNG